MIVPTVDDVLGNGRSDVISIGLLVSVWSGSRALNVFVDTISIMYGQSGVRGHHPHARAAASPSTSSRSSSGRSSSRWCSSGPSLIAELLPSRLDFLNALYWPVVVLATTASLTTLFHISTPRRSPWVRDIPGAVLALAIWVLSSFFLRIYLGNSIGGGSRSIYGPLAAPIVVLIWLYFLAIAVLIGAALNAAMRTLWPVEERLELAGPAASAGCAGRSYGAARPAHERPLTPMPDRRPRTPVREGTTRQSGRRRRLTGGVRTRRPRGASARRDAPGGVRPGRGRAVRGGA